MRFVEREAASASPGTPSVCGLSLLTRSWSPLDLRGRAQFPAPWLFPRFPLWIPPHTDGSV